MDDSFTFSDLVNEAAARIAELPAPANGQVRPVPDERTVRYYGTIGLLDRPLAMRGRTALYGRRHLAQVVAIKRLQYAGRSLAEIQTMLISMDELQLQRMSGVDLAGKGRALRREFWKRDPAPAVTATSHAELRIELAPNVSIAIAVTGDVALSAADVLALREAAAPLAAELARRGLAAQNKETRK